MKTILILAACCIPALRLCAQAPSEVKTTTDDVREIAGKIRSDIPALGERRLVTDLTFHRSFTKEFSKIVSVENANNGDLTYAALSLDNTGGSFNLAPVTFRTGDNWSNRFRYINGNVHFQGKLNGDGSSTVFENGKFSKEWQAGFTANIVLNNRKQFRMNSPSQAENQFDRYQRDLIDEVEKSYLTKVDITDKSKASEIIGNAEILKNRAALERAMQSAFSELEEKLAKPFWTATYSHWISVSADIGRTSRNIRGLPASGIEAKKLDLFTGKLIYNRYYRWTRKNSDYHLYFSVPFRLTYESTLSGITPNTWNTIIGITDSSLLIGDQKSVYLVNGDLNTGFSKGTVIQALYIAEWKNFALGVNASLSYDYFFQDRGPGGRPSSYTQSYGLVFPLRNKEGARAVNIEMFYSKKANTGGASLGNSEFWGLRFAIPVLSFK
jgi:hypothetical protein